MLIHHHQSLVNVNWDFGYATVLGPPFSFLTYVFFLHVARETQYIFQWETSERNIDEVPKRRHSTILSLQHEGSRYVLITFLSLPLIINVNSFAEFFSYGFQSPAFKSFVLVSIFLSCVIVERKYARGRVVGRIVVFMGTCSSLVRRGPGACVRHCHLL